MKLWKKIIIAVLIVVAIMTVITYTFFVLKGKTVLIKQLQNLTHKKVTVGYFGLTPTLHLVVKDLNIEGVMKADSVFITPNIFGLLSGSVSLNNVKIMNPVFTFVRQPQKEKEGPPKTEAAVSESTPKPQQIQGTPALRSLRALRLVFRHFKIKNGTIKFVDKSVGNVPLKITVKDINLNIANLYFYPKPIPVTFDLNANIPWEGSEEEGSIHFGGWIEPFRKNVEATLRIEGIDGVRLSPYYSTWVDLGKARIEKAKLLFTSQIHGLNNNLLLKCHLELTDIVRRELQAGEEKDRAARIADVVLDVFRALNQGKIALDFDIPTKLDRPEFGFANIKDAFDDKITEGRQNSTIFHADKIVAFPLRLLEGIFKGSLGMVKSVLNGTFAVGNEIKKSVQDTFKLEVKPKS